MTATMITAWPWAGDTPLMRARRVAMSYRAALRLNNRTLCDEIDKAMAGMGETWPVEPELTVAADGLDAVSTAEAARLVHVPTYEIARWACQEWPGEPGRPLLPRFRRRGREMTFLVRDVVAAARVKRGGVGLPTIDQVPVP